MNYLARGQFWADARHGMTFANSIEIQYDLPRGKQGKKINAVKSIGNWEEDDKMQLLIHPPEIFSGKSMCGTLKPEGEGGALATGYLSSELKS